MDYQLLITRFVPEHQHPKGDTFIEIRANVRTVSGKVPTLEFQSGYPYTVVVSRRQGHSFNHGCRSIEHAQAFLEQHRYDIELINPEGKVRAYYTDKNGHDYFYMGRSHSDQPHWRSEESRAAWMTESELAVVVAEAATYQWTKGKEIRGHIRL